MRLPPLIIGLAVGAAACRPPAPGLDVPFGLAGEGVVGAVRPVSGGCAGEALELGIWGPGWGTRGFVPAEPSLEDGETWLYFELQTGLGEGSAALRLRGETAMLPLGARPGEIDVALGRGEVPSEAALAAAEAAGAVSIKAEQEMWADGAFRILDGATLVGELRWMGDRVRVAVYDATWLSPEPVEVMPAVDGADFVLSFPVEPSLVGESASLRVNVPARVVIVPAGAEPTELDRRLALAPGEVSDGERAAAVAAATTAAAALEQSRVVPLASELAMAARAEGGRCRSLGELGGDWELLFPGYEVHIAAGGEGCEVEIEPTIPQHGRRFRGHVNRDGLLP